MKVLLIDDCNELLEVVKEILTTEGHEVVAAEDAELARRCWEKDKFDLVICDLVMPVSKDGTDGVDSGSAMIGVQTIHQISQLTPKVPVIAISGELVGGPLNAIQKFGAVTTLSKPFGRDELLNALSRATKP